MNTDALRALWKEAFGDTDAFLDGFFREGFSPDRCRTALREERLAAALYWFDCQWQDKKLAYIYAVATGKEFRGQGICRRLMEDTHRDLIRQGYAGAVLVPVNSRVAELYEKLGYRYFGGILPHTLTPAGAPEPLRELTAEAYGQKKSALLDKNAIRQEGATLAFLGTYTRFYETGSCLFSVAIEDGTAWFQEYLGDPASVPGILRTLGVQKGRLRLPDGKTPFAMFRSFTEDPAVPGYLGIALD